MAAITFITTIAPIQLPGSVMHHARTWALPSLMAMYLALIPIWGYFYARATLTPRSMPALAWAIWTVTTVLFTPTPSTRILFTTKTTSFGWSTALTPAVFLFWPWTRQPPNPNPAKVTVSASAVATTARSRVAIFCIAPSLIIITGLPRLAALPRATVTTFALPARATQTALIWMPRAATSPPRAAA